LDHRGGSPFVRVAQSENTRIGVTKITPCERNDFSTSKDADQSDLKRTVTHGETSNSVVTSNLFYPL